MKEDELETMSMKRSALPGTSTVLQAEALHVAAEGPARPRRRILYISTEDWFFRSHFLPMARAAMRAGFDVSLAARLGSAAPTIEAEGIRLIPLVLKRGSLNPLFLMSEVNHLRTLFRQEQPDIIHLIALKPIVVGGLAAISINVPVIVNSVTGVGFLGIGGNRKMVLVRPLLRPIIRLLLDRSNSWTLVDNGEDAQMLRQRRHDRVNQIGGAGVDPAFFAELPLPVGPKVTAAIVARMLWSKGIDTTIEAHRLLRQRGIGIDLKLVGPVDRETPNALSEAALETWSKEPGIEWVGPRTDVREVWRDADIAVLASRGGEGLPRTLLEAAACGRPIVTTDVPGCREFIRSGVEGFVVPPDDPLALADALQKLATDPELRQRQGRAARARVLSGYTEKQVTDTVVNLYQTALGQSLSRGGRAKLTG